jgi:hypothetical protein
VTVSAAELGVHRLTAFAVPESDRAAVGGHPSIAPLHERDQCGEEIGALLGETVSVAGSLPGVAVGLALEQALLDELSQPRGGDGLADPDTARPLFSFLIAGRLIARLGAGRMIAIGSTIFAAGIAWWALAVGLAPDYVGDMLGGIGVGLTLPTLMATGASSLPAPAFATGSAVINMLRQVGLAIGVAVLGAPATAQGAPDGVPQRVVGHRRNRAGRRCGSARVPGRHARRRGCRRRECSAVSGAVPGPGRRVGA